MKTTSRGRTIFLISLTGVAFSLPLSVWLTSAFTIITIIAWLSQQEWRKIKLSKTDWFNLLAFAVIYIVHILWMINTSEINNGLAELRLKLPLVIFPVILAFSFKPGDSEMKMIYSGFIAGILVSSIYGMVAGGRDVFTGLSDSRTLSPLISHIRLSMMAVFGIFISLWFILKDKTLNRWKIFLALAAAWFIVFIFMLASFTGVALLLVVALISFYWFFQGTWKAWIRLSLILSVIIIPLVLVVLIIISIKEFYKPSSAYRLPPPELTLSGNPYSNDLSRKDIENGNPVWIYLCEKELRNEWNKLSKIKYDSSDLKGQPLRFTLIRYMTSAGLEKDSAGVARLNRGDIVNIEHGMTNRLFSKWSPLRKKIYESVWQLDYYLRGGNPSGHSITQRIEFFKTGWHIFLSYPVAGVGTGDINKEYNSEYVATNTMLDRDHRFLCHNQYLFFLVSFGITGTFIIILALFFIVARNKLFKSYLPFVFCLVMFLSMFTEDTLETHTGVTFFALFLSVYVFGGTKSPQEEFTPDNQ